MADNDKQQGDIVTGIAVWDALRTHYNEYLQGAGGTGAAVAAQEAPNILVQHEGSNRKVLALETGFRLRLEGINEPVLVTPAMLDPLFVTIFNAAAARKAMGARGGY